MSTKRPLFWICFAAWAALLAFALPTAPAFADAHAENEMDAPWPHWRGHAQNGSSTETGLPDSWEMNGKNHLWTADIVLRSTPVVMNGRVYAIGRTGKDISEQERVACFDAKTGELVWEDTFNIYLTTIPFTRGGWSNPAGDPETGNLYTHGVGGVFRAYDKDGNILWSKSLTETYGRISGYGGRTNTPVIADDLVILSYLNSSWGGQIPRHRFWAFDKKNGKPCMDNNPAQTPLRHHLQRSRCCGHQRAAAHRYRRRGRLHLRAAGVHRQDRLVIRAEQTRHQRLRRRGRRQGVRRAQRREHRLQRDGRRRLH